MTDRDRLLHEHLQLPAAIASSFPQLLAAASLDDIIGDGRTGLVEAANNFDPARGCAFTTFAWPRVRGAIIDGARRMSRYSRPQPGRQPTAAPPRYEHVPLQLAPDVPDETLRDPDETIDRQRALERALEAIATLPPRERAIAEAHYFGGRTIQEAARQLGHSEFFASRLHARAIRRLRELLTNATPTGDEP